VKNHSRASSRRTALLDASKGTLLLVSRQWNDLIRAISAPLRFQVQAKPVAWNDRCGPTPHYELHYAHIYARGGLIKRSAKRPQTTLLGSGRYRIIAFHYFRWGSPAVPIVADNAINCLFVTFFLVTLSLSRVYARTSTANYKISCLRIVYRNEYYLFHTYLFARGNRWGDFSYLLIAIPSKFFSFLVRSNQRWTIYRITVECILLRFEFPSFIAEYISA